MLDSIKASAVLHQHQREKIDNKTIVANGFDLAYGWFVFLVLNGSQGIPTNRDEEELLNILVKEENPLSINEVSNRYTRHSKQWFYNNREKLVNKGLIKTLFVYDDLANKEIEKVTAGENSFLVLKGFNEVLKIAQQRGFNGFNGFKDICKVINTNRLSIKLSPIYTHIFRENHENRENLTRSGLLKPLENPLKPHSDKKPLIDKIKEVKKYCLKVSPVSMVALNDNFDPVLVSNLVESGQLIKVPGKDTYEWR